MAATRVRSTNKVPSAKVLEGRGPSLKNLLTLTSQPRRTFDPRSHDVPLPAVNREIGRKTRHQNATSNRYCARA